MENSAQEDAARWFQAAGYDLETAEAMLDAGRYLYVLFCCQQAIEKHLKGMVVLATGNMPPKTHDLLRLAEQAGVAHSEGHRRLLADLSNYYVETRYPEQVNRLAAELTRSLAEQCLTEAKEYLAWLDRQRR